MRSVLLLSLAALPVAAQTAVPAPADQIAAAVLPLPEALRHGAGVRGYDANLKRLELRPTRNGLVCTGDLPGDSLFDVRCYEAAFLKVMDRRRELAGSGPRETLDARFEAEVKARRIRMPAQPTAGYRMLGPIAGYDAATRSYTRDIERWQSVHFPYRTAAEIGLPEDRDGTMPYVMASGTWWSHVMIQHTPPVATPRGQPDRLGTLTFPNSGAASAQADFIRGVLLLHSFEYARSREAFVEAERKDPGFALAYWGEAMTHTHPIWNEQDLVAARAALDRLAPTRAARAAKAGTPRERAWLDAVEILYGEGSKAHRDTLYAEAMARVAAAYPDDEAHTFHALAILGLSQGVRDVPAYMRAGAIALDVLARNPDHPGAAHYAIHAFDDPSHAPLGLNAARSYSEIAPGAAHAQHMTTHIFLAMGMWPEVISQNILAAGPDRGRWQAGHYTYWLHYGLLQSGRTAEAVALLDELRAHQGATGSLGQRAHLMMARAQQVVSAERWDDPALGWEIPIPADRATLRAMDGFARGYAALRRGDVETATAIAHELAGLPAGEGLASIPALIGRELEAALRRARGDKEGAERMLREVMSAAAELPVEFGPPDFVKPPAELLGEWLLEDGRPREAQAAFAAVLADMPGRVLAVRGMDRVTAALELAGGE